jgi:molybdenum cofactor cytidylyltransferase
MPAQDLQHPPSTLTRSHRLSTSFVFLHAGTWNLTAGRQVSLPSLHVVEICYCSLFVLPREMGMGVSPGQKPMGRASGSKPRRAGEAGRHGPSAILLAAGASSRFLGTKQLAQIGGVTLVERALDAIPTTDVRETVVVVGHDAETVAKAVGSRKGVRVVVNADYRAGMGGSIGAGISALVKDTEGAMLLLADQPFVTRSLLKRMLRAFERQGTRGIVAAAQGDLVSPPAIFSRKYFRQLASLRGDQGARSVLKENARDVALVRVRSRRALTDIDTQEDLEAARRLLKA